MKKLVMVMMMTILTMVLFSDCRTGGNICLDCTITIAGIADAQPTFCGDRAEVDEKQEEFQEIVDRENTIVGQSASMECDKTWE